MRFAVVTKFYFGIMEGSCIMIVSSKFYYFLNELTLPATSISDDQHALQ